MREFCSDVSRLNKQPGQQHSIKQNLVHILLFRVIPVNQKDFALKS